MSAQPKPINRAARLAKMGAGIAGNYLAYQMRRPFVAAKKNEEERGTLQRKNAKQIREGLQELRGPVMKLGQALSMQTHMLNAEAIEELAGLQMQAPPMHPTLMRAQFKSAFGKYPDEVFRSFELEPFAASSFGQVHWAVTKRGEEVAVKIQYPAIRETVKKDFQMLRTASFLARVTGHLSEPVVAEVQRGILEETDYRKEAQNLEYFGKQLKPLGFVHVPTPYFELSYENVVTMSRMKGLRMQEFLQTNPSPELRDKIGVNLSNLFFYQLFKVGALHADPHPGNYLFNQDGTISLVDFGCVKYLKPEVVRCYAQFWSREWVHNAPLYAEITKVIFGPQFSPRDTRVRRCMNDIRTFYDEFHPLTRTTETLELADPKFMAGLDRLLRALPKNKFISPEFVFLSRTELGMCNLLHTLKARVPMTQIVRQWMPQTYADKAQSKVL